MITTCGVEKNGDRMDNEVVVDSDCLIALASRDDINHQKAIEISTKLARLGKQVFFPNTVIIETITTLKRAKNLPDKAYLINRQYQQGVFNIIYVDEQIQKRASELFEETKSKQNTFFDAIVVACAQYLGTDTIFSFDSWYTKLGFKLAGAIDK